MLGKAITLFGNGKQVRDILYIDDLVEAYSMALKNISKTKGNAYNIGGGIANSVSLLESINILEKILDRKNTCDFQPSRPGNQLVYISDVSKARNEFGWQPTTTCPEGMAKLVDWVKTNLPTISSNIQK